MTEGKMTSRADALDAQITMALEAAPRLSVPADFATRVAAKMPLRPRATLTPTHYGAGAAFACLVALMVLMVGFAPMLAQGSGHWVSIQTMFCLQFLVLAVWLVARRYSSQSRF
jgi:hypothetical protein